MASAILFGASAVSPKYPSDLDFGCILGLAPGGWRRDIGVGESSKKQHELLCGGHGRDSLPGPMEEFHRIHPLFREEHKLASLCNLDPAMWPCTCQSLTVTPLGDSTSIGTKDTNLGGAEQASGTIYKTQWLHAWRDSTSFSVS